MQAPYYPIIYVRGYAMTEGERDETASDPFCGFNVGSTVYRAAVDRNAPTRLRTAASATAVRGLRAPVAIEVAIALAVS